MKKRQIIALAINWMWVMLVIIIFLRNGSTVTLAQGIVLGAGLLSSAVIGWFYVKNNQDEPGLEEVKPILADTEKYILQMVGSDEDVRATVKAIFLLASKAAEVRYSVVEAAKKIEELEPEPEKAAEEVQETA